MSTLGVRFLLTSIYNHMRKFPLCDMIVEETHKVEEAALVVSLKLPIRTIKNPRQRRRRLCWLGLEGQQGC